jgi:rhodanese-related sulfurtransferase
MLPPMGVDEVLAASRAGIDRLTPEQTVAAMRRGALLVDTRTETQRREQGELPGALVIDRTVLEWRLDPACVFRIKEAVDYDVVVVVACRQGYSSSLAAASLRSVGLHRATDLAGGVEAWLEAGLPVHDGPADVRP